MKDVDAFSLQQANQALDRSLVTPVTDNQGWTSAPRRAARVIRRRPSSDTGQTSDI